MAAKRDSLTGVDTAWWRMEHPTNLMMITGVLIFDEPVDFDRLRHTVEKRLLRFDRFRQRVVQPRNPLATPYWEPEPNFDLRAHLHRIALRPPGDQQALEELVSYLMSTPLDFSKSPWEYHLIENYQGGAVLMGRLHHVMGDGIALESRFLGPERGEDGGCQKGETERDASHARAHRERTSAASVHGGLRWCR